MTEAEKELLLREQARDKILIKTAELKENQLIKQANASADGVANAAEDDHDLIKSIDDSTKFFLLSIPNQDCLMYSLMVNQIALTENSSHAFEKVFQNFKEGDSIVLFVTI